MLHTNTQIALLKNHIFKVLFKDPNKFGWNVFFVKKSRTKQTVVKQTGKSWLYQTEKTSNNACVIISYYASIGNYYFLFLCSSPYSSL